MFRSAHFRWPLRVFGSPQEFDVATDVFIDELESAMTMKYGFERAGQADGSDERHAAGCWAQAADAAVTKSRAANRTEVMGVILIVVLSMALTASDPT